MSTATICASRGHLVKTRHRRHRFCFTCRRRTWWTWTVWASDEAVDWYGPRGDWRCEYASFGNPHSDLFPGREYADHEDQ